MSVEITFLEPGNKFSVKAVNNDPEQALSDALALRQKIVAATGGTVTQDVSLTPEQLAVATPITPEQFQSDFPSEAGSGRGFPAVAPGLPAQNGGEAPVYVRTPEDPASDKQIQFLGRLGFKGQTAGMTKGQAKTQIDVLLGKL